MTGPGGDELVQTAGIQLRAIDEETFLIDPDGGIHALNLVGAAIWRCFAEPSRPADVTELLQAAFPDADAAEVANDVAGILEQMLTDGLLRKAE